MRLLGSHERHGAALIIVLAFVVLLTALSLAYFSQTTADRQIAHTSFSVSNADQIASSAVAMILGDLRQEIINGSASPAPSFTPSPAGTPYYVYTPSPSPSNMVPQRSGTPSPTAAPGTPPYLANLVRRSVRDNGPSETNPMPSPGLPSRASGVNSTTDLSANSRSISLARWNKHYLLPRYASSSTAVDTTPPSPLPSPGFNPNPPVASGFTPPDWVMVTAEKGAAVLTSPTAGIDPSNGTQFSPATPIGRFAYAIYDEGGILDINVAGYPTGTTTTQAGRKGSLTFADLTTVPTSTAIPAPTFPPAQVNNIVGWRNYATTQASNTFPNSNFASNLSSSTAATNFYNVAVNNTNGFLRARGDASPSPSPWPIPAPAPYPNSSPTYPGANNRTDQMFVNRQQLLAFRQTTGFSQNALQYFGTFSRESNAPSFSPLTPTVSTIPYGALASTSTAVNPNFLLRRAGTTTFTRFDGTTSVPGEPLVKTRFPLSRLAWITYKGPSASLQICKDVDATINTNCTSDPVIIDLVNAGVPVSTLRAGTKDNIKKCFGLFWDSRPYVAQLGTTPSVGQQWVYVSPTYSTASTPTGGDFDPVSNPTGNPASGIKRLDTVASEKREPDFFELLRATILDGSLGQNTGGGVTGAVSPSPPVFPDVHMSNKDHHIFSIGAAIIDQADPDSVPTRIQLKPTTAATWWNAYGVESLPYITQLYPIAGYANTTQWATYLLFQLWNPHIAAAPVPSPSPTPPQVRLRVDGNIAMFTGGNGQTYQTANPPSTPVSATGQSMSFVVGAYEPSSSPSPTPSVTPAPAASPAVFPAPASGTVTPPGFEKLPAPASGTSIAQYVGFRLPNYPLTQSTLPSLPPQLNLYFGTDSTHQFNATMEFLVPNVTPATWVPYNHFIGTNDPSSWIWGATVPVRRAQTNAGTPSSTTDQFNAVRLADTSVQDPDSFMKADPRATRFGIFQFRPPSTSRATRITDPLWPSSGSSSTTYPNGYGGTIADPAGPVEHAPLRFAPPASIQPYYPATLCVNDAPSTSARTSYSDNDGISRPGDSRIADPAVTTTGSSTPYYTAANSTDPHSLDYHPVMLNRPFRNVAELGYAFRDLPWKTLDLFSERSGDAGLLDVFCINDGTPVYDTANPPNVIGMAVPTMVAGKVSLNTRQQAILQAVLAGSIFNELDSSDSVSKTGITATAAPVIAANLVSATSAIPLGNPSELVTGPSPAPIPTPTPIPLAVLPTPSGGTHDQSVKSRREAIARTLSSTTQTRTWNLLIDVIAQSGKYPPGTTNLASFVVEGEQHYWVHVAIDRFTSQVIDKQIEVVNE